jgi:protein TonB
MSYKDGRMKVLFVCVGNACRSPMAEAIARIDASDVIEAFSAGLSPIGSLAGMTKQTLMRNGYWVEGLEPKGISHEVWEQADIVINLSGRAREEAFHEDAKVEDWEIEDPFGKDDINVYQRVFEEIRLHITELAHESRKRIAEAQMAERRARERLRAPSPAFVNINQTHEQRLARGPQRRWGTFAAFGGLIGAVSLTFGWVTMLPDAQTKMVAAATQKTAVSRETVQDPIFTSTDRIAIDPILDDAINTHVHSEEPPPPEENKRIPDLSRNDARNDTLNDMDQYAHPKQLRPAAATIIKTSSRPIISVPVPSRAASVPPPATANVKSTLVAKLRPLAMGSPSAKSPVPEIQVTPPMISTSNVPLDSPTAVLKEIKSPIPPPKPPTVPASITAAVAVVADPYPSLRIDDGGISKKQRQGTSLKLGHLLSRVEPVYPEAAKQEGIQGTVKLHAIIGRQGSVENLEPVDGTPVLVAAAVNAVRQWRYTETLLAGQSVETEEDIAVTFRLSNSAPPNN